MEDDWEAEDFVPRAPVLAKEPPKSLWDDEEASEEDVKESWEDEDQAKEDQAKEVAAKAAPAVKTEKKEQKKTVEKKEKASGKVAEKTTVPEDDEAKKLADKLHQQRLVEEADYQNTAELFKKASGDNTLENFIPKSESDFLEYAELVAQKLRAFEKSYNYLVLVKAVIRNAVSSLKSADAKEIASSVQVIANEKLKIEKAAAAGKKKSGGVKKKQLQMEPEEAALGGAYDDVDDYDFM